MASWLVAKLPGGRMTGKRVSNIGAMGEFDQNEDSFSLH